VGLPFSRRFSGMGPGENELSSLFGGIDADEKPVKAVAAESKPPW